MSHYWRQVWVKYLGDLTKDNKSQIIFTEILILDSEIRGVLLLFLVHNSRA